MRPLPFFVCCGQSARGSCAVPLWDRAEEQAKPGGNFEDARGSDRRAGRQAHVILGNGEAEVDSCTLPESTMLKRMLSAWCHRECAYGNLLFIALRNFPACPFGMLLHHANI